MIAVGIDVSKSKSTVAILNGDGSIRAKPFDVHHVADELQALVDYIKRTSEPPTILMEPTSHYHYPLLKAFTEAELPVCLINPYQMKKYGDTELRKAKTDKRDSLRIAQYALEKSYSLIPYTPQDQKYEDLRFLSRQYSQRISTLTVAKVQLLSLLDETMPGITTILPLKSWGLSVLSRVTGIFTGTTISPGGLLRQCPDHYAFHAGQNLPDKEFRYLRTVIVTAAVHWGFNSMLAHLLLTFQHRAGVSSYTSSFDLAQTCVFGKQLPGPILCGSLS